MNIQNIKNIKPKIMSAHGGKGSIAMKFFHRKFQRFRDDPTIDETDASYVKSSWNFFAYAELPISGTVKMHKHVDNDEFYFILSGEAEIIIDNKKSKITKGDVVLTRAGSSHAIPKVYKKLKFIATEIIHDRS